MRGAGDVAFPDGLEGGGGEGEGEEGRPLSSTQEREDMPSLFPPFISLAGPPPPPDTWSVMSSVMMGCSPSHSHSPSLSPLAATGGR